MTVFIEKSELKGSIRAEPSKSMAHRLLIAAGLSEGLSRIENVAESEDILATLDCLASLGADIKKEDCGANGESAFEIRGMDAKSAKPAVLRCRESGSTLRFFIPICALSGSNMKLGGSETLMKRPLGVYEEIFKKGGKPFTKTGDFIELRGGLTAGDYEIDGNISSQFVSGLFFALPLLPQDSAIRLRPPVESSSYIDMTIDALAKFGIEIERASENLIRIKGGQKYEPSNIRVEGDWSNAAFFIAMGVNVTGLSDDSLQPDKVCREYFDKLGKGFAEVDISGCPDLGPILMAYAAMHHGCLLTGTRRLKIKESDRGAAMKEELAKFGVETDAGENYISVGSGLGTPSEILRGHNDHRIVMSLAMMASQTGGRIAGAEDVRKSFPGFFERFREAGGAFTAE